MMKQVQISNFVKCRVYLKWSLSNKLEIIPYFSLQTGLLLTAFNVSFFCVWQLDINSSQSSFLTILSRYTLYAMKLFYCKCICQ